MTDIPDNLAQWRKATRIELLARRMAVTTLQRREWTAAITAFLTEGLPTLQEMIVGFCWPYKGEVDPRFAIFRMRVRGARAALPVVVQKAAPLQFREWAPGVHTSKGVFDLPVPDATPVVRPHVLLIPPIGFDSRAYRLGYGGGYFDRTLAAMAPQPLKIGIAFETSRIATIHPQRYDIAMDFVVTEAGIHQIRNGALEIVAVSVLQQAFAQRVT